MLWDDYLQAIAERMREPDMASLSYRYMTGLPYLTKEDLEGMLHSSLVQVLREVPESDWEAFASPAVVTLTGASPVVLPRNIVRPIAYAVDGGPTEYASIASYYQWGSVTGVNKYTNRFTFIDGNGVFKGSAIALALIVEPTLDEWKTSTTPILPPGTSVRVIDLAAKRILISDYVPEWRP